MQVEATPENPAPPASAGLKRDIKSLTHEELLQQCELWREPSYRAGQLLDWLYRRHASAWEEMTNLSKSLRARLASEYSLHALELVRRQGATDTTQKFLWKLRDGAFVESVLIPASPSLYGEASDRHTLCVSTQVGCAYGCRFCASGLEGWKRDLASEEIIEQVLAIERWHLRQPREMEAIDATPPTDRLVNNLVIMGMGEPLANYENLMAALRTLNSPWGGGIGARKITISTSGLVPQIRKLADDPLQFRLAISLHGATDDVRGRIMPVNRKFPLAELAAALDYYQSKKGRLVTFEYILIAGVNDSLTQTRPLAALASRLNAKVNLIPYNTVEGLTWVRPSEEVQESFLAALEKLGVSATLRREKGHDIDAACGQLRLRTERELREPAQSA